MLADLQSWMQQAIVKPGADAPALQGAGKWVRPSRSLAPEQRLGIYRGMYLLRMRDALAVDYPGLAHYFGEDGFDRFVAEYVKSFPSRSYTLNRLGDFVPEFIRGMPGLKRRTFLSDLARAELAMTQVFDEAEAPPLSRDRIGAIAPHLWEKVRLVPVAALRMLQLDYPAPRYLEAVREEQPVPVMRPRRTYVVYYRRDYALLRLDLQPSAYHLLGLLAQGERLGKAVETAWLASKPRVKEDMLFTWFQRWMSEGLFHDVRLR
jgi:hypothetical protein